ncbi:sulfotransferase [Micromonospora sp. CPCC 205371]|nr:sulfotransferase [Micromonospora sp. CPCC 205371]
MTGVVKVLYIAGWGRSGTTILDNILGSYENVFSAGELYYLWRRGLVQGRRCGCGEKLAECPLWSKVLHVAYGNEQPCPKRTADLQYRVTRVRNTRRLTRGDLDAEAAEYRDLVGMQCAAVAEVTGTDLVVDSSKLPPGAAVLARVAGVEPYLVQMVRDPRAVAYSWTRPKAQLDRPKPMLMDQHGPAESTTKWLAWNLLTEQVARGYEARRRRLRYEDFVADPRGTVEELLAWAGVPSVGGPFVDGRTVELGENHTVSGNPGRFRTGPVALRPDEEWRRAQPLGPRALCTALSFPLLHRYGYRVLT